MRHSLEFGPMVHTTLVPALALAAMIAVWLGTRQWSVVSLVTSCLAYGIVLSVLGGWPEELPPIVPRRLVLWKHG
jgi:ABC-type nitrate/sulfonate/bicarbonate transport system permease component